MAVLQHYYTSYQDEATHRAGFQVKAASLGISSTVETTIQRLISYRIPPGLEVHDLSAHPVALRYIALNPQQCIFLCSQSCGRDDRGRPGNFFAHSLILEPQVFREVPSILYWRNAFWCKEDSRSQPQTKTLPALPTFDLLPSLSLTTVWQFLAQGERRHLLHQLLCAVVHNRLMQRRIIIADTTEHTALWIAAVSLLLPPDYRPLLSFATYHHDPHQGQFLITGIAAEASFRSSDYQSYFLLDARQNMTGPVKESRYADLVSAFAQPDLYETRLRPLFDNLLSPSSPALGDELEDIANY
jgi:hypothetical protein